MKKLLIALLVFSTFTQAEEANEYVTFADTPRNTILLHTPTIEYVEGNPPKIIAWIKRFPKNSKKIGSVMTRLKIDCLSNKSSIIYQVAYDKSKELIDEVSYDSDKWESFPPESIGYTQIKGVCNYKKP